MKLRQMIPQRKLKATASVRRTNASTHAPAMEEEEEEPTIRFSTACIVVLLLHLVAIGGIYTFDSVKVNRAAKGAEAETAEGFEAAGKVASVSPAAALAQAGQETTAKAMKTAPIAATSTVTKKEAAAAPVAAVSQKPASIKASGKVHVVEKGENPVVIAKQYGVDYETLLTLNKIDDPRRLRIGQKLQIPTKP